MYIVDSHLVLLLLIVVIYICKILKRKQSLWYLKRLFVKLDLNICSKVSVSGDTRKIEPNLIA